MNKTTTVRMMMMTAMMNLNDGLDFILSHFEKDTLWPRKISTKATDNHQKLVYNKEQALAWFKAANYLDCRINAYPDYTEYKGINRQAPKSTFKTDRSLKIAYNKTMENFSSILGTSPTVISPGSGGFHFYQPVEAFVLEQQEFFLSKSANGEKIDTAIYYQTNMKMCTIKKWGYTAF